MRRSSSPQAIPYILAFRVPRDDRRKRDCRKSRGPADYDRFRVSPLFRRNEEKAARKAAAKEEIERLRALSIDDLAANLLPGLGPDGPTHGSSVWPQQLCQYLLKDYPGAGQMQTLDLLAPVNRALDMLEGARLVAPISVQRTPLWRITPLGERALAEENVRERLIGT